MSVQDMMTPTAPRIAVYISIARASPRLSERSRWRPCTSEQNTCGEGGGLKHVDVDDRARRLTHMRAWLLLQVWYLAREAWNLRVRLLRHMRRRAREARLLPLGSVSAPRQRTVASNSSVRPPRRDERTTSVSQRPDLANNLCRA